MTTTNEDVGAQVADLDARIAALESSIARLTELMKDDRLGRSARHCRGPRWGSSMRVSSGSWPPLPLLGVLLGDG